MQTLLQSFSGQGFDLIFLYQKIMYIVFINFIMWPQLLKYFLQKGDRLSFRINLELVNLEVKLQRLFLGEVIARQSCFQIN